MLPGQFNQPGSCAGSGAGLMLTQVAWAASDGGDNGAPGTPMGKGRDWRLRVLAPPPLQPQHVQLDLVHILEFHIRL